MQMRCDRVSSEPLRQMVGSGSNLVATPIIGNTFPKCDGSPSYPLLNNFVTFQPVAAILSTGGTLHVW